MYQVGNPGAQAAFLAALLYDTQSYAAVVVTPGGGGSAITLQAVDGQVAVDGTAFVRRQLTTTCTPLSGSWDDLQPDGATAVAYRGIVAPDGTQTVAPLGAFLLDTETMTYSAGGSVQLTAPDLMQKLVDDRFQVTTTATAGLITAEIGRLLAPLGLPVTVTATSTATTAAVVYGDDRDQAIQSLCTAIGAEVVLKQDGTGLVVRDVAISPSPVWTVTDGAAGNLIDASVTRGWQSTYNVIVVRPDTVDGTTPWAPVIVADTDPTSPTYAGTGRRQRVRYYSSPLITSSAQALTAGQSILAQSAGLVVAWSLTSLVNPVLEEGDAVTLHTPKLGDTPAQTTIGIVETFTVPLKADTAMPVTFRATGPSGTAIDGAS